jgi:hypothetical protein
MTEEDPDLLAGKNLDELRGRTSISERFRLSEELENARYQNNLLAQECRNLEFERDEARRLVCELYIQHGGVYRKVGNHSAVACSTVEEIAELRDWDCYKDSNLGS